MGRGSYIRGLTRQLSRTMPVLKPTIPPFYRRIGPVLTAPTPEPDTTAPSVPQFVRANAPQPVQMVPTSSTVASDQAKPLTASQPKSELQEGRFLNPSPPQEADLAEKAAMIEPRKEQSLLEADASENVVRESRRNVNIRASDDPTIDLGTPSFYSIPSRTRRSQPQKETMESRKAISRRTVLERHLPAASFLSTGNEKEAIEETIPATSQRKSSVIPTIEPPSLELRKLNKAKLPRSEKSTQELQPRKKPMEKDPLAATQFESPGAQGAAGTRERRQESQARSTGGVHIGSLEVKIMPPVAPPAPIIKPQQARPAPATVLSRSFTSSLGLSQG